MSNENENNPIFTYKPLNRFLYKICIEVLTILLLVSVGFWILWWIILNFTTTAGGVKKYIVEPGIFNLVLMANIGFLFTLMVITYTVAYIYTKSMSFFIFSSEIVVKKGVVNKTEKHVPFRTVTNISTRYGIFDKIFGIGTVEIETAGKSGQSFGPEEKIEGIINFTEIRDVILDELRKFRGQYTTGTEVNKKLSDGPGMDPKSAILKELREIKQVLESKL